MTTRPSRGKRGFSLVELLVGMVIGMMVVLTIFQIVITFEEHKRTTTEGAGAQENGLYAVTTMERDIRMAGWGLTAWPSETCLAGIATYFKASAGPGSAIADFSLQSVSIQDGGSGSDTLTLMSGTSMNGNTFVTVTDVPGGGSAPINVSSTVGYNDGDMVVLANSDGTCTYSQLTKVDTVSGKLQRIPGGSPFNPPGGFAGEASGAKLYNLGSTTRRRYAINSAKATLSSEDIGLSNPLDVADNIVMIKAQYGVSNSVNFDMFESWMPASKAPWITPGAAEVRRIQSIRLFVVARSPLKERPVSGSCNVTTLAPQPSWPVSPAVSLSGTDWQCYRYKAFETIIPLRNSIWANS